jgi:hypothetical protein
MYVAMQATKSRFPHVVFGETPAQHQRTGSGQQCAAARGGCQLYKASGFNLADCHFSDGLAHRGLLSFFLVKAV